MIDDERSRQLLSISATAKRTGQKTTQIGQPRDVCSIRCDIAQEYLRKEIKLFMSDQPRGVALDL